MALKHKLDAAAYAALPPLLKAEYSATPDDKGLYVLDVPDFDVVLRTVEHVKGEKTALKAKYDAEIAKRVEVESALEAERADKSKGDERLTKRDKEWADKLAKRETELTGEITTTRKALENQMVDAVVNGLAGELAAGNPGNAKLLAQLIRGNFKAEVVNGQAKTIVLENGEPSIMTPAEFRKKIVDSGDFKSLITANNSSGGGAAGATKGGGAAGEKKISEMNATEQAQFANKNPDAYREYIASVKK